MSKETGAERVSRLMLCRTCKHRVTFAEVFGVSMESRCDAIDGAPHYEPSQYDGRLIEIRTFRPTLTEARATGSPCGPGGKLYEPNRWELLRRWWRRKMKR